MKFYLLFYLSKLSFKKETNLKSAYDIVNIHYFLE